MDRLARPLIESTLGLGAFYLLSRTLSQRATQPAIEGAINTSKFAKLKDPDAVPVVLIGCGSFNPVTFLHLRIFEMAKTQLQKVKKYEVIGGFLSPVSDAYGKAGLLGAEHRVKMCQAACLTSDWLATDEWETKQQSWTRTSLVLENFEERINQREILDRYTNGKKIRIMLVSGGDLVKSFLVPNLWKTSDLHKIITYYGLVIIERYGTDLKEVIQACDVLKEFRDQIFVIPQPVLNDVSSTKVREVLRNGESAGYLAPKEVLDYIYLNHLYGS